MFSVYDKIYIAFVVPMLCVRDVFVPSEIGIWRGEDWRRSFFVDWAGPAVGTLNHLNGWKSSMFLQCA